MVRRLQRKRAKGQQPESRRKMQFEALEPRILLSADLGFDQLKPHVDPLLAGEPAAAVGELLQEDQPQAGAAPPERSTAVEQVRELVIVDPAVTDYQTIIDQVVDTETTDYQVEVLDPEQGGLEQVGRLLAQQSDLSALHIISHGSSGKLRLGNSSLDRQVMAENAALLQQWGAALSEDADILIYGCNVAAGETGLEYISSLAELTRAEVAASADPTGGTAGADWILEVETGRIEAQTLQPADYSHRLADHFIEGTAAEDTFAISANAVQVGAAPPVGFISGDNVAVNATSMADTSGSPGADRFVVSAFPLAQVVAPASGSFRVYGGGDVDSIDFSAITADLTFRFNSAGELLVSDGTYALTAVDVESVIAGSGNNRFVFTPGAVFSGTIAGSSSPTDSFDFSSYDGLLSLSGNRISNADQSLDLIHSNIDDILVDYAKVDISAASAGLKTGLNDLVAWAGNLQEYEEIGQTLAGVTADGGVTLGNSLNLQEVFERLRNHINQYIDTHADITARQLQDYLDTLQETVDNLAVDATQLAIDLSFVNGQPELVFNFSYAAQRSDDYLLDLGKGAEDIGLLFDDDFSLLTQLDSGLGLGLKLQDDAEFFFNIDAFTLLAEADAAWDAAAPLTLDVGFLAAEATGSGRLRAATELATQYGIDPTLSPNVAVSINSLQTDFDLNLAVTVPEGEVTGLAAFDDLSISLTDGNPFQGADIESVVYTGFGADNLGKFKEFNAATFISQVGTVRDWFGSVTESEIFNSVDIPFVTPALDTIFDLADAVGDTLLYDDADDGNDDGTTLVVDLRKALADAGLDKQIRVEGDGQKLTLIALDKAVSDIAVAGASAIGFAGSETFHNKKLTAADAAPVDGKLVANSNFTISLVEKGVQKDYSISLLQSATDNNETVGNDHAKLLDENNQATFKSAQDLANKLIEIFGLADNVEAQYDATTKRLTFALKFNPVDFNLDVPVDFNFDLSPIGNIGTVGSPDISLGAGVDIELTLGLDLSDKPAGSKDLTTTTNLVDLKGIDSLEDAIKTNPSLSPEAPPEASLSTPDSVSIEFANSAAELTGDTQLVFSADTIERKDGLNWFDDGFRDGQQITITGSNSNDGSYEISQLAGALLTITAADLTVESKSNIDISGAAPTLTEDPKLNFTSFGSIRRSEGSWSEDGFNNGDYIIIEGAGVNNGVYQINEIVGSSLLLWDSTGTDTDASFTAQTDVENVTIVVPDSIKLHSGGNWAADGFKAGQQVFIAGTEFNNRTVLIADLLEGGSLLMLSAASKLTDESLVNEADLEVLGGSIIRLSQSASFQIDGVTVKVLAQPDSTTPFVSATDDNNNQFDLINDINSALDQAGLKEKIRAELNNGQIILSDISEAPSGPFILTTVSADTAHTELGFATTQTADSDDLLITLSDNSLHRISLDGSTSIQDVIDNIQSGTNNRVKVEVNLETNAGLRLLQVPALSGNPRLTFDAATNTIVRADDRTWGDDGFALNQSIRISGAADENNGTHVISGISADGKTLTLSTGVLKNQPSIKDVRISLVGPEIFRVAALNGSKIAGLLGILKADVSSDVDDSGKVDVDDSDGIIVGDAIAGVSILDRFFIEDPKVEGNVFIRAGDASTDGISVSGDFGFVSIDLNGYGAFDTRLTLDLDDPTPTVAGITVNELVESLSHLSSIVSWPTIGGAQVSSEALTFAGKTIVRTNNEIWQDFQIGEYVSVSGATAQNNGQYKITDVAGSILTLERDENFHGETISAATVLNEIGTFRFNLDVVPDFGLINEEQASEVLVALFDFGNPFVDTDFKTGQFTLGSDDKSFTLDGDWTDRIGAGADVSVELEATQFASVVYQSPNSFLLAGDQSKKFELGAKLTAVLTTASGTSTVTSQVKTINFDEATGQTTFTIQDEVLSAGLSTVSITTKNAATKVASISYDPVSNKSTIFVIDTVLAGTVSLAVDTPRDLDYMLKLPDLGDLVKFDEIGISQIIDGLIELSSFLADFEAFGFLDDPIPVINVSVNDVLSFADKFDSAVQEAKNNPAGTLQVLEMKLKEALGIPFGIASDALGFTDRLSAESGILTGNALTDADVAALTDTSVFRLALNKGPGQLISVETASANTLDELLVNINAALSVAFASKVQARRTGSDEVEFFTSDSQSLSISNPIDFSIYEENGAQLFRIDFGMGIGFTKALDVAFDLGGDTGLMSGAAGLEASGAIDFNLGLGIDLNDPGNIYMFDSAVTGQLQAIGDDLAFRAGIGPLGVFINEGSAVVGGGLGAGDSKLFTFGLDFDDDPDVEAYKLISDISLEDDFVAALNGIVEVDLPVYFPAETLHKGSVVWNSALQLDLDGNFDVVSDLGAIDPQGNSIPMGDLFTFDLNELTLMDNMLLAVDGIDAFLGGLQDVLDGEVFGLPLPFIGDKLSDSARFIEDLRDDFIDPFRDEIENLNDQDENIVSELLFDLLGPAGIGLILDANADNLITIDDIALDTNIDVNDGDLDNDYMQWNLLLGQNLELGSGIGFDLGIPGLGLETQGDINLNLGWELDFGFGISFAEAFYLDIDDESELEVTLEVNLPDFGLSGQLAFLQLDATGNTNALGEDLSHFIAKFGIDVYNKDDDTDKRLAFSELGSLGIDAGVAGEAIVDLNFELKLNSELIPGLAGVFPKVVTDFYLDWSIDADSATDELELVSFSDLSTNLVKDGLYLVEFRDVSLDLGSFISDFIDPVLGVVREVTEPMQPIIDVLTTPLPVISDLGPDLTILDLAEMTGKVNTGFIESIAEMITFINAIPLDANTLLLDFGNFTIYDREEDADLDLTNPNEDLQGKVATPDVAAPPVPNDGSKTSGFVNKLKSAGDFDLPIINDPSQIFNLLLGKEAVLMTFDLKPLVADFSYKQSFPVYGPLAVAIIGEIAAEADLAFGFDTFGISEFADSGFRNPALIFNGFYVSDTDLPTGEYGTDVPELTLSGGLGAAVELNLGIASAGAGGGVFFDVFFNLFDPSQDGKVRVPEMINSIINEFRYGSPAFAPLALFDVSGEVYAKLFAYIEFLFTEFEFDITPPITLVEFDIPFTRAPTLATELGDGVLQLNMGEFASQRLNNNTDDGDEHFVVTGSGRNVTVSATFGGTTFSQDYSNVAKILALAGEGNDIIDLSGLTSSSIEYELEGGVGNDQILLNAASTGKAVIHGGVGDDRIVSGGGNDQLYGDAGNDRIFGNSGADIIFGDEGEIAYVESAAGTSNTLDYIRSRIRVTDGDDLIEGGGGDDQIFGGGGEDMLSGNANNDLLIGDGGILRNILTVTARNEVSAVDYQLSDDAVIELIIEGESFAVTMPADLTVGNSSLQQLIEQLNTQLLATEGIDGRVSAEPDEDGTSIVFRAAAGVVEFRVKGANAVAVGELGLTSFFKKIAVLDDTSRGDGRADKLFGGSGNDVVYAGRGNDEIMGETGADKLYGEEGFDLIYGNEGADRIFGGSDNDRISGGGEDDHIEGGSGNDEIWGDWMVAETIAGAAGADSVWGGTGLDLIFGGAGNDFLFGDSDPDKLFGEEGADTIDGGHGADKVWGGLDGDTLTSSLGDDFIDGGSGGDDVYINTTGGDLSSLVTVFDSGVPIVDGTDTMIVSGTAEADKFLLRAARADIFDASLLELNDDLAQIEIDLAEIGVLKALQLNLSSLPPRAFIAKLNNEDNVERVNYYDNLESIILNTLDDDDQVASDNTNAEVTINGGKGDDTFQVGQLYNSLRDTDAGIDRYDLFDTVQTTKGFLSSGINAPMTINGEDGEDSFVIFRNLQVLTLNGGEGDDNFLVKAFALEGSVDDPDRDRTDITGAGGADLIQYAVNAPVGINGGDGLDTVIVLGTEFGDDFVVTEQGVYGAGLNVSFTGIEVLKLDTAEGNDRIFVQSTGTDHLTEIFAGEGSDTFFIAGDTPPVVSQDLLGHSGVITHQASSGDSRFDGLGVDGISANVGDDDEPFVRIIKDDGLLKITEDGLLAAQYSLVLSRPPRGVVGITAITPRPSPGDEKNGVEYLTVNGLQSTVVVFDETNWFVPQTVTVAALQDLANEGTHFATINHVVTEFPLLGEPSYEKMAIPSVSVAISDDDQPGLILEQSNASRVIEGANFGDAAPFADSYTIRLNQQPDAAVSVTLENEDGQLTLEQSSFDFDATNWNVPQTVRLIAADDTVNEGFHHGYIKHFVTSSQTDQVLPMTDSFPATILAAARSTVLLSYQPVNAGAITSVHLDGDLLAAERYNLDQKQLTILNQDGVPTAVTEEIIVIYSYSKPGFQNVEVELVGVEIGDNDAPGVLVMQAGGSTNVIEVADTVAGFDATPFVDHYQVVLTAQPTTNVTVNISPEKTKTSARPPFQFSAAAGSVAVSELGFAEASDPTISLTSGKPAPDNGQLGGDLRFSIDLTPDDAADALVEVVLLQTEMDAYQSIDDLIEGINSALEAAGLEDKIFSVRDENRVVIAKVAEPQREQVETSVSTLTFTPGNWNVPQNVIVTAVNDAVVDGGENKSFAPVSQTVARIQGPLIINGAGGDGSDAGLGADPFRLPGETNDVGNVVEVPSDGSGQLIADQVVLHESDIDKLGPTYFKSLDTFAAGDENDDQKAKIFIQITSGPGVGQERVVVARNGNTFILAEDWDTTDLPTAESRYIFKRQLGKVNEAEQVDVALVANNESLADSVGSLTSAQLSGLGMGPDVDIGGIEWQGGITYTEMENLTINLGPGNDQLAVLGIQSRQDFQTVTVVNAGAGNDQVNFDGPQAESSGLFALHLEEGDDQVTAVNTTAPLVIFGDEGVDRIDSGDGGDIVFGDFGRVDYFNGNGELVTRFGLGQRGNVVDTVAEGKTISPDDFDSYPFAQTDGGFHDPTVATSRLGDRGWDDTITGGTGDDLLIGGAGADSIQGGAGNDVMVGDNGRADYRNGQLIEVASSNPQLGGDDLLSGGDGDDLLIGGAGADSMQGGAGNDAMVGDNGRADYRNGQLIEVASGDPRLGGDDLLSGGDDEDLLIGGALADRLYGNTGNDYIVGDAGRATFSGGLLQTLETIDEDRFIGGDDWLEGGPGNDVMFGGHGNDTFVGNFETDLMIGEYARLILSGGKAESVVRLGQGRLDLLANQQFGLYNPQALIPSLSVLNPVQQASRAQQLIEEQRPDASDRKKRVSHSSSSAGSQAGGLGYQLEEGEQEQPPVDEEQLLPPEEEPPADGSELEPQPDEVKLDPEEDNDLTEPDTDKKLDEEPLPQEEQNSTLKAAVAGLSGWGVASSKRRRAAKQVLDLDRLTQQREWRWEAGRLSKGGWQRVAEKEHSAVTGTGSPVVKSEIRRKEYV